MDKDLVNNQIVLMRKIVRNVKRLVKQKLNKQMKKLELRLNKQIQKTTKRLENKISNKKKELIAINGINVDEVSKQALIQTKKFFEDIIRSGKSSFQSKALARIAINENLEKVVNKFKDENPNCDQWLPSQIELWQQKKLIKKNQILKKKGLITDDDQNSENTEQSDTQIKQKTLKTNKKDAKTKSMPSKTESMPSKTESMPSKTESMPSKTKSMPSKTKSMPSKTVLNEKKVPKKEETNKANESNISIINEGKTSEEKKPKSDPFFLSKDCNLDEESDENLETDEIKMSPKKSFRNETFRPKKSKFSKISAKTHNSIQNKSFKPKKFETKPSNRDHNRGKGGSGEYLHPSWAAKRSAKDKVKIDLNERPVAKKIKFSDK